jgi:hypothetical protein
MLRQVLSTAALATIALPLISHTPAMATIDMGPATTNGCYQIGDERIKFTATPVTTNVDSELRTLVNSISTQCDVTHIANTERYYWRLPDNSPKFLLLSWKNLTTREYGYFFIQNTPTTWWYKTNSADWRTIPNGESKGTGWSVNGFFIDIITTNPPNKNGWTPNDIIYYFRKH